MVVRKSRGALRSASNPLQSANQGRKAPLSACMLPGKTSHSYGEDCLNQRHTAACWYPAQNSRLDVLFVCGTALVKGSVKGLLVLEVDSCAQVSGNPAGLFGLPSGCLASLKCLGQEIGNRLPRDFPSFCTSFFSSLRIGSSMSIVVLMMI